MSVAILVVGHACAEVTDSEAKALGTTLTAFGADPKASADGLVPAYTGEPIKPPASYQAGSGRYPDPFSSEKPVVSITQKNMAEYSDKLTESTKELLKRYSDLHRIQALMEVSTVYVRWPALYQRRPLRTNPRSLSHFLATGSYDTASLSMIHPLTYRHSGVPSPESRSFLFAYDCIQSVHSPPSQHFDNRGAVGEVLRECPCHLSCGNFPSRWLHLMIRDFYAQLSASIAEGKPPDRK
jgi:hypothetical protein